MPAEAGATAARGIALCASCRVPATAEASSREAERGDRRRRPPLRGRPEASPEAAARLDARHGRDRARRGSKRDPVGAARHRTPPSAAESCGDARTRVRRWSTLATTELWRGDTDAGSSDARRAIAERGVVAAGRRGGPRAQQPRRLGGVSVPHRTRSRIRTFRRRSSTASRTTSTSGASTSSPARRASRSTRAAGRRRPTAAARLLGGSARVALATPSRRCSCWRSCARGEATRMPRTLLDEAAPSACLAGANSSAVDLRLQRRAPRSPGSSGEPGERRRESTADALALAGRRESWYVRRCSPTGAGSPGIGTSPCCRRSRSPYALQLARRVGSGGGRRVGRRSALPVRGCAGPGRADDEDALRQALADAAAARGAPGRASSPRGDFAQLGVRGPQRAARGDDTRQARRPDRTRDRGAAPPRRERAPERRDRRASSSSLARTVDHHVSAILRKLDAGSRGEAGRLGRRPRPRSKTA